MQLRTFALHRAFCGAVALTTIALATPAPAAETITSSGYALSADLGLLGFLGVAIAPVVPVGGSAPPAYNLTQSVLTLDQNLLLGVPGVVTVRELISTGLLTTTASSSLPGTPVGQGSATVNDLSAGLSTRVSIAPALNILTIGAGTVTSTSSVEGNGAISATGITVIEGLTLSGLALGLLTIDGSAFVNPAPNTVLLNVLGLSIVLNEQLFSGNGVDTLGLTTNAIHVAFRDFLVGGSLLTGDIIIGSSSAAIAVTPDAGAVPEPATWLQLITGFGLIGVLLRSRRRGVVRAS